MERATLPTSLHTNQKNHSSVDVDAGLTGVASAKYFMAGGRGSGVGDIHEIRRLGSQVLNLQNFSQDISTKQVTWRILSRSH